MLKTAKLWIIVALIGFSLMPWYSIEDGFWTFDWLNASGFLSGLKSTVGAPALIQAFLLNKTWLLPIGFVLVFLAIVVFSKKDAQFKAKWLAGGATFGLFYIIVQGLLINRSGIAISVLDVNTYAQVGLGYGGAIVSFALLFILTTGIACFGHGRGDVFVVGSIGLILALVAIFVFFPISHILIRALRNQEGVFDIGYMLSRLVSDEVWGFGCLVLSGKCGPALNSVFLALMTATGTTLLGLAFALVIVRTSFPAKNLLRILTILPLITPPFVVGLALILLFGRAGIVTSFFAELFNIDKGYWIYGFFGIWLAQMLSFTPIAFLVLIGVVKGVNPSVEEASQTLRANRWQTFKHVTFPLIRPGLANAFLLGFVESIADFGNPVILGGNYSVLSTDIYFSIVGAQEDQNKTAVLGIILLFQVLSAFIIQRKWVGNKSYTTVTGKGGSGQNSGLNSVLSWSCYSAVIPWVTFTLVIYGMIMFGGFVQLWGYNHSFTLDHYIAAFSVTNGPAGIQWTGAAWDSFWTTIEISAIAAPLTAALGMLTAYLLMRQNFVGKRTFEFGTMLSFAIPGTVLGVSYILAFNVPPIELTGTGTILVICFIFRNMPVGVRSGIAAMSQIDKSLDEASLTLGANSFITIRKVILPLLIPAIIAALTYSFIRAITSVSAVIFLVSADNNMATSYIIGLVENGDYGVAIAYSSVLIITMITIVILMHFIAGEKKWQQRENRLQKIKAIQAKS